MIKDCTKCGISTEFKEEHNKRQDYRYIVGKVEVKETP